MRGAELTHFFFSRSQLDNIADFTYIVDGQGGCVPGLQGCHCAGQGGGCPAQFVLALRGLGAVSRGRTEAGMQQRQHLEPTSSAWFWAVLLVFLALASC